MDTVLEPETIHDLARAIQEVPLADHQEVRIRDFLDYFTKSENRQQWSLLVHEPTDGKDAIDVATLAAMFEAGLASVKTLTKAKPGDKTMIDALVPAVEAVQKAAGNGASITDALERGAQAAEEGAAATKDMQARFGRAKNIGEKSVGNADPGATSVSLIFKGFVEGVR